MCRLSTVLNEKFAPPYFKMVTAIRHSVRIWFHRDSFIIKKYISIGIGK